MGEGENAVDIPGCVQVWSDDFQATAVSDGDNIDVDNKGVGVAIGLEKGNVSLQLEGSLQLTSVLVDLRCACHQVKFWTALRVFLSTLM